MKGPSFLVVITCCVTLVRSTCIAEPSNSATEQRLSENRRKTIDPKTASVPVDPHQDKVVNNRAIGAHASAVPALTKLSRDNLRTHGPSPAKIGGPVNTFRNTAAINGTGMKRKR